MNVQAFFRSVALGANALRNPRSITAYLGKRLYPERYSPWTEANGAITWNTAQGFDWGEGDTPPQIAAINYHMVQALRGDVARGQYDHAVEIGCGYGRLTPWLGEFASRVTGVDPNPEVLSLLDEYYPSADIATVSALVQHLPFPDDTVDLVVTRAVLQHIPPDEIETAVREMRRIASDDAHILLSEASTGREKPPFHPRSEREYAALFEPFSLVRSWQPAAPATSRDYVRTHMTFERDGIECE